MSECLTAWCVAHRRLVYLQCWGPDAGRWCHLNGYPCPEDPGNG